jgi:TolA-binding protein
MTVNQFNLLIEELRSVRDQLTEHAEEAVTRLTRLETQIAYLPEKISKMEAHLQDLQNLKMRVLGICAGVSAITSIVAAIAFHIH